MKHKRRVDQGLDEIMDPAAPRLHAITGMEAHAKSPARQLQADLDDAFAPEAKWPPRLTLGFLVVTCGVFWAALFVVLKAIFG